MRVVVLMLMALLVGCSRSAGQNGGATPSVTLYWDHVTELIDGTPLPGDSVRYQVWESITQLIVCEVTDNTCTWSSGQWGECYTFAATATDLRSGLVSAFSDPLTWCAPSGNNGQPRRPQNLRKSL